MNAIRSGYMKWEDGICLEIVRDPGRKIDVIRIVHPPICSTQQAHQKSSPGAPHPAPGTPHSAPS